MGIYLPLPPYSHLLFTIPISTVATSTQLFKYFSLSQSLRPGESTFISLFFSCHLITHQLSSHYSSVVIPLLISCHPTTHQLSSHSHQLSSYYSSAVIPLLISCHPISHQLSSYYSSAIISIPFYCHIPTHQLSYPPSPPPRTHTRYFDTAEKKFTSSSGLPTEDFTLQMCKMAVGILSGRYSKAPNGDNPAASKKEESAEKEPQVC